MKAPWIITALGLFAATAQAGTLSDALARHADRDIAALRAHRDDLATRCTLGAIYAKRNDLSRAALYLTSCDDATLPDEVASDIARIDRDVKKQLRDSDLSVLEVLTRPDSMVAEIDVLPDETFTTPATLYLKPGKFTVRATKDGSTIANVVTTYKRARAVIILDAGTRKPVVVKDTAVDFSQDNATETQQSGPPPAVAHKNLMPIKYQRGMHEVADASNPDAIEDPLATHQSTTHSDRSYWLGFRLGGGMFDDGATSARAGMSLAATGRLALTTNLFAAARLDWSRRGGSSPDASIDVLGANAGIGITVLDRAQLAIALIGQLRGDLRLADTRMTSPVRRTGVTAALGAELALPHTPFTAGIRFEQGLTTLVPNSRDRALLLELGVDLR